MADRSGTPDTSLWSEFSSVDTGSIICLSQAGTDEAADAISTNEPSDQSPHRLRRVWWMKHLSLLAVLQAARLAVGLAVHHQLQNAADASQITATTIGGLSSPIVYAFIWIALVQGVLG